MAVGCRMATDPADSLISFGCDFGGACALTPNYAGHAFWDSDSWVFPALLLFHPERAQPIVMTTVAMGAGMLPIALKIGADADFRAPMAIAVIGGLITSTLLSLFYVPVVFTYVDDLKRWVVRMFSRKPVVISPPPLAGEGRVGAG